VPIYKKLKVWLLMGLIFVALDFGKSAFASDIILKDLNSQAVNLFSYTGKPAILFFWTTWCPYCRKELNRLNEQYLELLKEGIVPLVVNVGESSSKVKRFFKGYQFKPRVILDQEWHLADKYDLIGVPTYVFLDKTGKVVAKTHNLPADYKSILFKQR